MGDENKSLEDTITEDLSQELMDSLNMAYAQAIASVGSMPPMPNGNITISNNAVLSVTLDQRTRDRLMINDNMLKVEHREDGTPMDDGTKAAIRSRILHAIADKAGDRVTYTKRKDLATNQTIVTGKVWVFNEKELSDFIDEVIKNVR